MIPGNQIPFVLQIGRIVNIFKRLLISLVITMSCTRGNELNYCSSARRAVLLYISCARGQPAGAQQQAGGSRRPGGFSRNLDHIAKLGWF